MSLLRLAPWRRAPRLLLGQPLVALAVAGAAAVLSVATAATPAFTSTLGTAEVARELAPACPLAISPAVFAEEPLTGGALLLGGPASSGAAPGAGMAVAAAPLLGQRSTTVAAAARELPLVGPPQLQLVSERLTAGQDASSVVLVSVAGWRRHITPVGASGGPGLWVPVALARREGLAVGSRLPLGAGAERVAGARVAGVYAPLAMRDRVPAFWCGQRDLFVLADAFSSAPLPDVLLGDPGDLLTAVGGLDLGPASAAWVLPLEMRRLRLDRLQHLVDRLPALGDRLTRGVTGFDRDRIHLHADITFTARRAAAVQSSVAGAVRPVAVATVLVALLLVAAAGGLWVERQQREVRLLSARGVGPVALGLKALLETGPAAVVGAVAGAALALVLVRGFGPSSVLGPHAVRDAVLAGAGSTLAALLVLGGSAGTRAVRGARAVRAPAPAWVRWLPVELLLLGGAWLALRRLSAAPLQAAVGTRVPKLDVLVIIFPLLLLTGAAVVVARFTSSALGVAARGDGRRGGSDALWLALRRAAGARGVSAVLVAAAALPLGALCYAATITDSVRTTVEDKALSSAGAASVVRVRERSSLPPLAVPATVVRTAENPDTSRSGLHLLGVDPATFVSAAAWLPEDSGTSLPTLMRRLAAPASPDTLPVIAVGDDVPASLPTGVASRRLSVLVVGRAKSFPSAGRGSPRWSPRSRPCRGTASTPPRCGAGRRPTGSSTRSRRPASPASPPTARSSTSGPRRCCGSRRTSPCRGPSATSRRWAS